MTNDEVRIELEAGAVVEMPDPATGPDSDTVEVRVGSAVFRCYVERKEVSLSRLRVESLGQSPGPVVVAGLTYTYDLVGTRVEG